MVIGENQKFVSVLIVPSFIKLKAMYEKEGKTYPGNVEAIKNTEIRKTIQLHIEKMNQSFAHYESIKKFEFLPKDWTVDSGEMTPKLSLKRKTILEANKNLIEKIYNE